MIFMSEEGINITVSSLTVYNTSLGTDEHHFAAIQILKLDFVGFFPELYISKGRLHVFYLECFSSLN